MNTGGFTSCGRTGSNSATTVEAITSSLVANKGKAFDSGDGSLSWLECFAHAKAINAVASAQRRFVNQVDPRRMTDSLARWEKIFGLPSPYGRNINDRRRELAARFLMLGKSPINGDLTELLLAALPDNFDEISYLTSANANTHTKVNVTVPGGITEVGDGMWSSTIYYIAVGLVKPTWQSNIEFSRATGVVHRVIDSFIPAWCTFDWYKDGPSGIGFYLDDENNLDNERFD